MDLKEFLIEKQILVTNLSSKNDFFKAITDIAFENDIISNKDEVILGLKEREKVKEVQDYLMDLLSLMLKHLL